MKKQFLAFVSIIIATSAAYSQRSDNDYRNREGNGYRNRHNGFQDRESNDRSSVVMPNRSGSLQERQTAMVATEVANIANNLAQKITSSAASDQQLQQIQVRLNAVAQDLMSLSKQLDMVAAAGTCVMFTEPNFQGISVILHAGETAYNLSNTVVNGRFENLNDQISSVGVGRNCTLQMWENKSFGGRLDTYTSSTPQLSNGNDNFYTSAKCFCN